nr:integrase, catalytic region, zinc finger, CCHC-type, peptidase aspartic, catalytic [Tanacetum cinerariifolium]
MGTVRFRNELIAKIMGYGDYQLRNVTISRNDPKDFTKLVNAIALPQDISSTSDHRLIKLENQVQRLMEAHLAPTLPAQVNKVTTSCEMCSGPHDTQYCMEDPEQAFIEYASSRTDEAGGNVTQQPEEPEPTLKDEFQYLHLNPPVLEILAHVPIYNAILDKYVESLELGKNGLAFVQGEVPANMEDPGLFTLPCRLGDSKPFDTLADLESCVNIILLYLFKKLNIRLLEETDHIFGLADRTKSYPVGIVKEVEVHIGKLKLLNDLYVIDMKMAKIAIEEGITRSVFEVKEVDLGEEEAPYWTTLEKRKSYKPRPHLDGVGARTLYYARKDFLDYHLPEEWEIARDAELYPFKDTLELESLIENPINWDKLPKNRDGAWNAKIRLIDPDEEELSISTTRKLSGRESPREMVKDKKEKDKIETKPDKNGKRGKAQQCQSPTIKKAEKEKKIQAKGPKDANPKRCISFKKTTRTGIAIVPNINYKGQFCHTMKVSIHKDQTWADNRPPMLEKNMYDSWKSRIELYMLNRPNGRMILESVEQGPLIWPMVEVEGVTRPKKYSKLSAAEAIQADCDIKATNIILQGLPPEVYALVSTHKIAKELWERIQMLMQGTSLTKQERECKLYDAFDKFAYQKGETLRDFYLRFSLLLNDMNMYNMKLEQFQVNTKFLNTLPSEWSKFVTDVKLVRDLHTTNVDQLHAFLGRPKKYSELSAAEAIQADCDIKATNIILQGLPPEVYAL